MKKKTEENNQRTLFVTFNHESKKKILIPEGCKITFGPLCPGGKNHNGSSEIALRVYKGASQIAVFVNVKSYYETDTVSCISKITKRANKAQAYEEGGVMKNRNVSVEVSEWKNELEEEESSELDQVTFNSLKLEDSKPQLILSQLR